MANYIAVVCFCVLAGIYLYAASLFPVMKSQDPMGPRVFPVLLGVLLLVGSVLLFLETVRTRAQINKEEKVPQEGAAKPERVLWAVVAWTVIFLFAFEPLGYVVATTVYIFPLTIYFNAKKWWTNTITSLLFPIGVYVLFVKFLGVMLPKGVIPW
jgi:putative tricarboxylic transport membrane protein